MQAIAQVTAVAVGSGRRAVGRPSVQPLRRSVRRLQHRARSHRRLSRRHGAVLPPRYARDGAEGGRRRSRSQLEAVEHRRKVIICLGMSAVCDVEDPPLGAHSALWPHWVAALTAAARANVSVYCLDPTGLNQRATSRGVGRCAPQRRRVVHQLERLPSAAYSIWRDAGRYYLLGYWPSQTRTALGRGQRGTQGPAPARAPRRGE